MTDQPPTGNQTLLTHRMPLALTLIYFVPSSALTRNQLFLTARPQMCTKSQPEPLVLCHLVASASAKHHFQMYFRLQGKRQSCVIGSARLIRLGFFWGGWGGWGVFLPLPPPAKIKSRCDYHNRTNLTRCLIKIKQRRDQCFHSALSLFALHVWMFWVFFAAEVVIHEKSLPPSCQTLQRSPPEATHTCTHFHTRAADAPTHIVLYMLTHACNKIK